MKRGADFIYRIWDKQKKKYCASTTQNGDTKNTMWHELRAVKILTTKWYGQYSSWYSDQCDKYMKGDLKTHPGIFLSKEQKYEVRRFKLTSKFVVPWNSDGVLEEPPDERKSKRIRKPSKTIKNLKKF